LNFIFNPFCTQLCNLLQASGAVINATCDNELKLYADGAEVASSRDWTSTQSVTLPSLPRVLAVACKDLGTVAGILVSVSGGVHSDSSWRCAKAANQGWNQVGLCSNNKMDSVTICSYAIFFIKELLLVLNYKHRKDLKFSQIFEELFIFVNESLVKITTGTSKLLSDNNTG
jgi:hypothetical protein